jgi:hypothetical protein
MAHSSITAKNGRNGKSRGPSERRPGEGSSARPSGTTVERDDTYGLISVIYHSLQGADTCAQYEEDARRAKNEELANFFEQCRLEQNARAVRGRRLLAAHLEGRDDDDDPDDDVIQDSNPLVQNTTD